MLEFLKRCGLGVLYIVAAPFALAVLVLFAVYGLLVFLFMGVKSLILFFTGRSVFDDLPEDIEAKRRLGTLIDTRVKKPVPDETTMIPEKPVEAKSQASPESQETPKTEKAESPTGELEPPTPGGEA